MNSTVNKIVTKKEEMSNLAHPHIVFFIEDGQLVQDCKSIKIDLRFFKSKYFIEPPKFISKLPEEYKKI